MKKRLSLFCITLALLAATVADAQMGQTFTDQYAAPAFQSVSGDLINPLPLLLPNFVNIYSSVKMCPIVVMDMINKDKME